MSLDAAAKALYEIATRDEPVRKPWDEGDWKPGVKETWYEGARAVLDAAHPVEPAPSEAFAREQAGRAARGKDHEAGPWCRRFNCTSHPEPVGVSDEAVEKALDVIMDDGHNGLDCRPDRKLQVTVRAALEAAQPLMGATPDRYRLAWLSARRRAAFASKAFFAEADAAREMESERAAVPFMQPQVVIDHRPGETCSVAAEVDPETGFAALPHLQPQPVASRLEIKQALHEELASEGIVGYGLSAKLADALFAAGVFREAPTREQIARALHQQRNGHTWLSSACLGHCSARYYAFADTVLALMGGAGE